MSGFTKTMLVLTIIGAINWLLVGLFNWNLVAAIFGSMTVLTRIIYVIVGLAGIYCLSLLSDRGRRAAETTEIRREA